MVRLGKVVATSADAANSIVLHVRDCPHDGENFYDEPPPSEAAAATQIEIGTDKYRLLSIPQVHSLTAEDENGGMHVTHQIEPEELSSLQQRVIGLHAAKPEPKAAPKAAQAASSAQTQKKTRTKWPAERVAALTAAVRLHGNNWKEIVKHPGLEGLENNQCRLKWRNLQMKRSAGDAKQGNGRGRDKRRRVADVDDNMTVNEKSDA